MNNLGWQPGETISVKYELDVGKTTVYVCHSSKPESEVVAELRKNFSHIINKPGITYQIFKTIKSRIE